MGPDMQKEVDAVDNPMLDICWIKQNSLNKHHSLLYEWNVGFAYVCLTDNNR